MSYKMFHIFGGGTECKVAPHLFLGAPGSGKTARDIAGIVRRMGHDVGFTLNLTRMAENTSLLRTNSDVERRINGLITEWGVEDSIVVMSCAMVDYGRHGGYDDTRMTTEVWPRYMLDLEALPKVISKIREARERKGIYLVGFKQVHWGTVDEERMDKTEMMTREGMKLIKKGHCNLVVVNDSKPNHKGVRDGLIITPEEGVYGQGLSRMALLEQMVDIANLRSRLTFTETVLSGDGPERLVTWDSPRIPNNLRTIVNELIKLGAYRNPLGGSGPTPGHFGTRIDKYAALTTIRGSDFRTLGRVGGTGLVEIRWDGATKVLALGAKPSVGGQSQRLIFDHFGDYDSIIHFHGRVKNGVVSSRQQMAFECGSHECGKNTVEGLAKGNIFLGDDAIRVTMLEKHGPNILIKDDTPVEKVLDFIKDTFTWG